MAVSEVRLFFESYTKGEGAFDRLSDIKDDTVGRRFYYNGTYERDVKDKIILWFANRYRNLAKDENLVFEEYKHSVNNVEYTVKICESGISISARTYFAHIDSTERTNFSKDGKGLDTSRGVCVIAKTLSIDNNGRTDKLGIRFKSDIEYDLDLVPQDEVKIMYECIEDYLINYIAYDFVFRLIVWD